MTFSESDMYILKIAFATWIYQIDKPIFPQWIDFLRNVDIEDVKKYRLWKID